MTRMVPIPAFVEGRAFDVLVANQLAVAFSPRLQPGHNRLRSLLLDPEEQAFQQDYYADQGSESDEKLRLLASMAQTRQTVARAASATP
jgi:MmyB-like transcription regulator ligand binding domain